MFKKRIRILIAAGASALGITAGVEYNYLYKPKRKNSPWKPTEFEIAQAENQENNQSQSQPRGIPQAHYEQR
jgi:hypothetical protein